MNVLVRSLGRQVAAAVRVSAAGDVFHFSLDLRPSMLFDCSVIMCGAVVEKCGI